MPKRRLPLVAFALLLPSLALAQPWASEPERAAGRAALAAATQNRYAEAEAIAAAADPLARKLVTWQRLQARGQASAGELVRWIESNPDWPFPDTIARRAEEALALEADDALALRFAARLQPRTLDGAQRVADAMNRAGRIADATAVLRNAWPEAAADATAEAAFAERNAAVLRAGDHAARFERLAWARDLPAAQRMVPRLDPARRAVAETRLALASERGDPDSATARDLGVQAERARLLRRRDRDADAARVWAEAVPLQRELRPDAARAIWTERQVLARKLLRLGDARGAYQLAAAHGQPGPGEPRQEAEFLAGFIALRRLDDPATAARHFAALGEGSRSVITRARSAYWQGRAAQAQRDEARARQFFTEAAALPTAFYGQLAALALGDTPAALAARINAVLPATPDVQQAVTFTDRELVKAVLTLADLGDTRRARIFLLRAEELSPDAANRVLLARLANYIGRPDHAVWVARRAGADGVMLWPEGWPTPYAPPDTVEPALVHAVSRQESNFDAEAVSPANARGVMQLLPSTAAAVARRIGMPYSLPMLTAEPAQNMRLGAQYLADMLARYGGAMPLAAAAYNAGPGRVDEWVVTYGDPRAAGGPEMLDWMEQIPFSETRNYVQRVIENMMVYRARDPAAASRPHPLAATRP